jgi:hypothetical protein
MKLSDISPLAGMVTGKGAMGKLIGKGFGGVLPAAIARSAQRDAAEEEEAERQRELEETAQAQPMKKGGKVSSASSRADGCAQRGKTKGRML